MLQAVLGSLGEWRHLTSERALSLDENETSKHSDDNVSAAPKTA